MSSAGSFTLIANDGKADRMIMATQLLLQRIQDTQCARKRAGKSDITPTLTDIERTHILYVNAHFKPFAAIGYEYNKVRPQSGTVTLGSGVTFSIPQFGDFFNDMVCRIRLSAFQGVAGSTPLQTNAAGTLFPYSADTPTDGTPGDSIFYNIVDAFGNVLVAGTTGSGTATATYRNLVRYCEFPGNRIMVKTKFDVNGNPLDEYDTMIPVMMEKFCVAPNKRVGHDRLCGQQVPLTGYAGPVMAAVTDADSANTPAGITRSNAAQSNQTVALFPAAAITGTGVSTQATVLASATAGAFTALNGAGVGASHYDVSQQQLSIVNGPQTPKPVQPPLELWVKQQFWFNNDVRLSIASVCIPFGQRFITMDLAAQSLLAYEFPSIYLEKINNSGTTEPVGAPLIQRQKTYTPIHQKFGMTDITIEKMELYINNIFVNSEIHDIYIKRIGFSLIRVFRQHTAACNQEGADEKLLSNLKWPIEYMFVGLRPNWNVKDATVSAGAVTGNLNVWRDWHRLTRMVDASYDTPSLSENAYAADTNVAVTGVSGTTGTGTYNLVNSNQIAQGGSSIGKVIPNKYWLPVPTVDSLSLTSHGVTIYDNFNDTFFNQYAPLAYGGAALNTPEDPGALFVNMCLIPRAYQPSSHLNISRARETYILLISDGSAILRYST
jgi:hypothetical protein